MKLEPKAKPVRFRIKSGGQECRNLEDLRQSFNVDDIRQKERKQLIKWLNLCGGSNIARELNARAKEIDDLEYFKIFFEKKDNKELLKLKDELNKKGWKYPASNLEDALLMSDNSYILQNLLHNKSDKDKVKIILKASPKVIMANEAFFLDLGKGLYINKEMETQSRGLSIIRKLADSGSLAAKEFIRKNTTKFITPKTVSEDISNLFENRYLDPNIIKKYKDAKLPNVAEFIGVVYTGFIAKKYIDAICLLLGTNGAPNLRHRMFDYSYLSNEKLFLCIVLYGLSPLTNKIESKEAIIAHLNRKGYKFAQFLNRKNNNKPNTPNYIKYTGFEQIQYGGTNAIKLIRIYFEHFLDPEFHNGDLSTL